PPVFSTAPTAILAQERHGSLFFSDGFVRPDGCHVVNTAFTVNSPHPPDTPAAELVPNQTHPTIGDRLSDASLSCARHSGGWNAAIAGDAAAVEKAEFQFHHQPFAYFEKYADGTPGRKEHLKDEADFIAAAKGGTLPNVSFVKPVGVDNEHPGYATLARG